MKSTLKHIISGGAIVAFLLLPTLALGATGTKVPTRTSLVKAIEAIERRDQSILRATQPEYEPRKAELDALKARAKNTKATEAEILSVKDEVSKEAGREAWERMIGAHLDRITSGTYRDAVNRFQRMKNFFAGEVAETSGTTELMLQASAHLAAAEAKITTARGILASDQLDFASVKTKIQPYLLEIVSEVKEANLALLEVARLVNKSK